MANPENGQGAPAALQFHYTFKTPFAKVAEAFVNKYNWEKPARLTTIEKVEQLDDDRVVMYRRHDIFNAPVTTWEQVVINRQNSQIESSIVGPNPNGSAYTLETTVLRPNLASKTVSSLMDTFVYDVQGMGSGKVELFKNQVLQLQKALKFTQWVAEQ